MSYWLIRAVRLNLAIPLYRTNATTYNPSTVLGSASMTAVGCETLCEAPGTSGHTVLQSV